MVDTQTLAELSRNAGLLREESDALTSAISALNDQLVAMDLRLEFWLENQPLTDTGLLYNRTVLPKGKYRKITLLGFARVDDEWQLAVRVSKINYVWDLEERVENVISENWDVALSNASRDIRLLAVEAFDDLLDGLNCLAQDKIRIVRSTKAVAEP